EAAPAATAFDAVAGLELAGTLAAGNGSGAVVIGGLAGRGPSAAEVLEAGIRAQTRGVVVDVASPPARPGTAVELAELHVPQPLRAGSSVELLVSARSAEPFAGVLEVTLDGAGPAETEAS